MTVRLTGARRTAVGAFATILALALSGPTYASGAGSRTADDDAPPTDRIVIDVVTINGSGCPRGTTDVDSSPDNTSFHVTYGEYVAHAGGNSGPTEFRKNCQLSLRIHVPQGFTFAIAKAEYRGFAHIEPGAEGVQLANYYFQGESASNQTAHHFPGRFDGRWQGADVTAVAALVWQRCGDDRNLNVNTELRVRAGTSNPRFTSFMAMTSSDASIRTIYHVSWKRC